jgi:hypothetical protein
MMDQTQCLAWFEEYRQRRYLERATDAEMAERLDDIVRSLLQFADDGTAVVQTSSISPNSALVLLAHFFAEARLRNRPDLFARYRDFNSSKYPNVRRAAELWRDVNLKPASYMVKFGKKKFLEPLLTHGSLRLSPASFYREPSLVSAIRDDELQFDQQLSAGFVRTQDQNGDWRTFPLAGPARINHTASSNYYVSCYAVLFDNRLFDDFDADACLIIRDLDRYCGLLKEAVRAVLPEWSCFMGAIEYRDPYVPKRNPNVYFTKHFRYCYQREFRLIWSCAEPQQDLPHIDLTLGELSSFCDLMCL